MLLSLKFNSQTESPYIHECNSLCTRVDYYMFTTYCSIYGSAIVLEIEIT